MKNYKNNHKRHRFRNNGDRNFKRNGGLHKNDSEFSNVSEFRRRNQGRNNQNASKLIEKYNELAREALSNGDKILSENYLQHADHFLRITEKISNDKIQEDCARSPGGFEHHPDRRGFWEVGRDERLKLWDRLYDEPGFGIWLQNFREIFTDEEANAELSEYIAGRIRQRVKDPITAEKLIPKDHGFGVQRVPLETNYYEAYNRANVQLIDISETPVEQITETGIKTSVADFEFDIIIYATGFDAITGAYDHIDIRGRNGERLKEKWDGGGIQTYLGIFVHGFPNMLMPAGPQSGSASSNYPRGIENGVNWVTALMEYARVNNVKCLEASAAA